MSKYYKLVNNQPVPCELVEWAKAYEDPKNNRQIAVDVVGDVRVSTVFLGLDHGFGEGPPVLFETMIFEGEHEGYQDRCCTYNEALEMHKKALALVQD